MTRRILFYLPRSNSLRVFAPVIAHLLREAAGRASIRVAFPAWPISKPELQPASSDITRLFGDAVTCCPLLNQEQLETLVAEGTDVLVTYTPIMSELSKAAVTRLREQSRTLGVTWIALPYLFSQDHYPLLDPDFVLKTWDIICTVGSASIRYVERSTRSWTDAKRQALLDRLVVTGYPALDGVRQLAAPGEIRSRYSLPSDAPIICVATAPMFYPNINSTWFARGSQARFRGTPDHSVRGLASRLVSYRCPWMIGYREYLAAIRRAARAHGAVVVAKTRVKHEDPPYLTDFVDRVIGDDSFFPTTALELLSVSTLYVGFHSAMAIEALALRVLALTVLFQPSEQVENPDWRRASSHFYRRSGGLWNVSGASESINGIGRTARSELRKFERSLLGSSEPDEPQRLQFLADYFNWPCDASARVAEVLLHGRISSSRFEAIVAR